MVDGYVGLTPSSGGTIIGLGQRSGLGLEVRLVGGVESHAFSLVQPGTVPYTSPYPSFAAETLAILGDSGNSQKDVGVVGLENMPLRIYEDLSAELGRFWIASGPPPDWGNLRFEVKPNMRVLEEGDLMAACSYVTYNGYWSHAQRAGSLIRPVEELEDLSAIARSSADAALSHMMPGVPIARMARAMREKLDEHGIHRQEASRVGHGIGLDYGELPVPNERNIALLQTGMTLALHAGCPLRDPAKFGVPLGDMVHVTPGGFEYLANFTREPFLAG